MYVQVIIALILYLIPNVPIIDYKITFIVINDDEMTLSLSLSLSLCNV
jgi:hypothetical protein